MWIIGKKSLKTCLQIYFLRYVFISLVITGMGFACVFGGVSYALHATQLVSWGWLDRAIDAVLGSSALWFSAFLFPLFIPLLAAVMGDAIAGRIDKVEYGVASTPSLPLWPQITGALHFMAFSLLLNMFALVLLIFPPAWLVAYYALNGWLMGNDFFESVAVRHVLPRESKGLRKGCRLTIWFGGIFLVFLTTLPVVNLCVPFVAVVWMVHVFWKAKAYSANNA